MTTSALPDWLTPPRPEGWFAEDLDHLPDAPKHVELWDGALILNMSPQRRWHHDVILNLQIALRDQAPEGLTVLSQFTIILDNRTRPEPDIIVTRGPVADERTWVAADEVLLAVEVVSPESAQRDRKMKPPRYAESGIANFWRVEDESGKPVVHTFERDETTGAYVATGIHRGSMRAAQPFEIAISL